MKRRVISLRDDRHIFTERYLHRREYHENEVENDRLDDGGRPSRPATKDIKLKAEMARDGQLSTSNRSKMKVLAREKATFRNCLVSPDVVSLYKTTQFSNARPLSSLCYKTSSLRYTSARWKTSSRWKTRGGGIVCQKATGRKIRSCSSSFFLSIDRVHPNYQASISDRDQMGGISDKRRYR